MLCTKIIFANDNLTCAQGFSDFLHRNKIKHKHYCDGDLCEMEADADDEELYDVCCKITDYVKESIIRQSLIRYLCREYRCFNSDERNIIISATLSGSPIKEIPGRMYIYVKMKKAINPFGFYKFMCKDIEGEIYELASQEAERLLAINDNCDFIDLLKSFAEVSSECFECVELTADRSGIRITGCTPESEDNYTEYGLDSEDVLAELVTMNPEKIVIFGREEFLKNDISSVITAVFEGRIKYK